MAEPLPELVQEHPEPRVARSVALASVAMIGLRFAFRILGLLSTLILVRLLAPSDFGLVGLATAVFGVLDQLTEMSLAMALIRSSELDRAQLDTAWTLGILRGLLVGGAMALSAGVSARWLGDPRVAPIVWVMAFTTLLQSFENVGTVYWRRNLRFDRVFTYRMAGRLTGFFTTLALAWLFRSYWALVAGIVSSRLLLVPLSYAMHDYRPRLSLSRFHDMFHFSKWLTISNFLGVLDAYSATLLFGKIGGARAVGLWQVAWQIASLPISEIAAPVREPIYSGYAKLLNDLPRMRQHFADGFGLTWIIVTPLTIGLFLTANFATALALGPQWADAAALIRPSALYALFDSIGHFTHNVFIVKNRQRGYVAIQAVSLLVRFPLFIFAGETWGIEAALWTLTATAGFNAVLWTGFVFPVLEMRPWQLIRQCWRTVVAAAAMAAVVYASFDLHAGSDPFNVLLPRTLLVASVGALVHVSVQIALWAACGLPDGPEARLASLVRSVYRRGLALTLRRRIAAG